MKKPPRLLPQDPGPDQKAWERTRQHVWLTIFAATAASTNCSQMSVAATWADKGLEEFEKRFTS